MNLHLFGVHALACPHRSGTLKGGHQAGGSCRAPCSLRTCSPAMNLSLFGVHALACSNRSGTLKGGHQAGGSWKARSSQPCAEGWNPDGIPGTCPGLMGDTKGKSPHCLAASQSSSCTLHEVSAHHCTKLSRSLTCFTRRPSCQKTAANPCENRVSQGK